MSILIKSGFEVFYDKDSVFLEEYKLFYEKEKQKGKTLESMVKLQKENLTKMVHEEKRRRKHDEALFKERQELERQKWKSYQGEAQKMYREFESTTSKSRERLTKEMEFSMNIQNDLLKEISKIRGEFASMTSSLRQKAIQGDEIQNQVMQAKEKEYMEMTFKLKSEEQKSRFDKEKREMERKHRAEVKNLKEEMETLRRKNNGFETDFYRMENHVRLLQQKIREDETSKQTQVEFSNTLCNVGSERAKSRSPTRS